MKKAPFYAALAAIALLGATPAHADSNNGRHGDRFDRHHGKPSVTWQDSRYDHRYRKPGVNYVDNWFEARIDRNNNGIVSKREARLFGPNCDRHKHHKVKYQKPTYGHSYGRPGYGTFGLNRVDNRYEARMDYNRDGFVSPRERYLFNRKH